MGRYKLQQMLDKRFGKDAVSLNRFSKNIAEKKTVLVGKTNTERVLSEVAEENINWLQEKQSMSAGELQSYLPVIWHDFLLMSDEDLCLNFRRINGIYNGMKALDMLGEDSEEARLTVEAVNARMEAMANPYYDLLDPKAFDNIPSNVLEEILLDPEFYEQDPDLYADEVVSPAYFGGYIKHLMEQNRALENLQMLEIEAGLNQTVEEAVTELRLMRLEYTKSTEERQEELMKQMNEPYRVILGAAIVLEEAKKNPVYLKTDDLYQLISKENIAEKTKDIPDGNIEAFRSSTGENTLYRAIRDGGQIGANPGVKAMFDALYTAPVPQEAIPEPPAPPTEMDIKRAWFNDLARQLKEIGINDPMSMQLLRVRGEAEPTELENLPSTFEGGMRAFQLLDEASKPALMPVGKDGNLINPLKPGENPAAWTFDNMPVDLELVSDEQIDYLYRMAQENRLHIQCADPGVEATFKNRYIRVDNHTKASISKDLASLDAEFKARPDAQRIDGYSREAFNELIQKDGKMNVIELGCATLAASIEMNGEANAEKVKDDPHAKDYFDYTRQVYYSMRNSRIGFRDAYSHASSHKEWYLAQSDAEKMTDRFVALRKRENDLLPEEKDIDNFALPASEEFDLITKQVLKKTGCKTISKAMEGDKMVRVTGEDTLDRTDTMEFMTDVSKHLLKGEEVFLNGEPYTFAGGYGLKKGINKEAYVKEFAFLAERLRKTEHNWTKNTEEYDILSECGKALPGQAEALNGDTELNFDKLQALIDPIIQAGDSYIEAHKLVKPDSRQTERIKIINRYKDLAAEIKAKNTNPGMDYDYRIAEKIVTAGIIKMKRPELLMNESYRATCIQKTMTSEAFQLSMVAMEPEEKLELLKTPGKDVLKKLSPDTAQVLADPQAQMDQAQPQIHK